MLALKTAMVVMQIGLGAERRQCLHLIRGLTMHQKAKRWVHKFSLLLQQYTIIHNHQIVDHDNDKTKIKV